MKICYFGVYNQNYSRNEVITKGFKENGIEIIECKTDKKGIIKYFDLVKKHWKIRRDYDYLFVAFPGQQVMILARFLTKKFIIFDAFTSLYDSLVFDRQTVKRGSLKAKYYFLVDYFSCKMANKILVDTKVHADYFKKTFKIKKEKIIRVFVGADIKKSTLEKKNNKFIVHFFGSNIPLQGVRYILKAAAIVTQPDIEFHIVGTSIRKEYGSDKYKNVKFFDNVPYEGLGAMVQFSDISLGIFGDTPKAKRVIPNKVYLALAVGAPIITGRSKAAEELLENRVNAVFVNMADEKDLANKIIELKENSELRINIAENGYNLFINRLTPKKLIKDLLYELELQDCSYKSRQKRRSS